MTEEDWVWLAGFIDGEGCFHIARTTINGRVRYQGTLSITSTTVHIIEEIGKWFHIKPQYRNPPGKKQYAYVVFSSRTMKGFIERVLPHLRIKDSEAVVMKEFIYRRNRSWESEDLYRILRD